MAGVPRAPQRDVWASELTSRRTSNRRRALRPAQAEKSGGAFKYTYVHIYIYIYMYIGMFCLLRLRSPNTAEICVCLPGGLAPSAWLSPLSDVWDT